MSHIPYYGQSEHKGTQMNTTNKNGYEIRAYVMELAKDYVEKQTKANLEYVEKMHSLGKATLDEYLKAMQPYTMKDIMDKTKEMYSFVSFKDK